MPLILDSVAAGLFTVDDQLRITTFNPAAERITGTPRAEALGRPCHEVFRTRLCRSRCPLKESMVTGRTVTNQEITISPRDGRERVISVNTAALLEPDGRFVGAVETFRDVTRERDLERELADRRNVDYIVGRHGGLRDLCARVPLIARSDATVLIEGASGTGKGLLAKALHQLSPRAERPFVHVTLGALPEGLLEAELFGHVKGAFTDAHRNRAGRLELARGGTIFLDEIGDTPLATQVKLLRVLQEREFEPVGSSTTVKADVRVVAATNRDLAEAVRAGRFREDLFYRLGVFRLRMPSLVERLEDLPDLARHFLGAVRERTGRRLKGFEPEALRALAAYGFPGNVRELENIVEHAAVLAPGETVRLEDLPEHVQAAASTGHRAARRGRVTLDDDALLALLKRHQGNVPAAAVELGVHRTTLWRHAVRLGGQALRS